MELILLGLAGLGGLALLLQSKPIPSKEDAEKAFDALEKNQLDPEANTVMGKYKAFVMGDYDGAMPYLVNSKDVTLKTLAEHELDGGYTALPADKVKMGDEWVNAAKKIPALNKVFYERAAQWYGKAWPKLDGNDKAKLRAQAAKLAASRPPGSNKKIPSGWIETTGMNGTAPVLDGSISRTGSHSIKIMPPPEKSPANAASILRGELIPIPVKPVEVVAFVRSDGTTNGQDRMALGFWDANGQPLAFHQVFIQTDYPFWNPITIKAVPPEKTARAQIEVWQYSKSGNVWVDDVSMKVDGQDLVKNGSFEGR